MNIKDLAEQAYRMGYFVISIKSIEDANKDFKCAGEETEAHHVKDYLSYGVHKLSHGIVSLKQSHEDSKWMYGLKCNTRNRLYLAGFNGPAQIKAFIGSGGRLRDLMNIGEVREREILTWLEEA